MITLIQSNLFWENVSLNLSNFEKIISSIKNTDIILLPEMFNTAFSPKSNHLAESMDGNTINWMKEISKIQDCAIAGTLMIMEGKNIFNRLVWILKNGTIYTYDKHHLFSLIKLAERLSSEINSPSGVSIRVLS